MGKKGEGGECAQHVAGHRACNLWDSKKTLFRDGKKMGVRQSKRSSGLEEDGNCRMKRNHLGRVVSRSEKKKKIGTPAERSRWLGRKSFSRAKRSHTLAVWKEEGVLQSKREKMVGKRGWKPSGLKARRFLKREGEPAAWRLRCGAPGPGDSSVASELPREKRRKKGRKFAATPEVFSKEEGRIATCIALGGTIRRGGKAKCESSVQR